MSIPVESLRSWSLVGHSRQWASGRPTAAAQVLHTWLSLYAHPESAQAMPIAVMREEYSTAWQKIRHPSVLRGVWFKPTHARVAKGQVGHLHLEEAGSEQTSARAPLTCMQPFCNLSTVHNIVGQD